MKLLPLFFFAGFVIRKLHLVRPDLIPYPIDIAYIC
jgi:hypothetical protein